jgi:hypothetical protein
MPSQNNSIRLFARVRAKELTGSEISQVAGGLASETDPGPDNTCWVCEPNNIGPGGGDTKVLIRDR